MTKKAPHVIVVGAGAAGIIAAWRAASLGARVTLVEKTNRIGTKILVSGGGKCNVAHAGALEDVIRAFRPEEARFLRPACYRFTNEQIVSLMTSRGLRVYTRPDGRIFPVDQTAKDVVAILRDLLEEVGVSLVLEAPVVGLINENGGVCGVRYRKAAIRRRESEKTEGYQPNTAKNLLRKLDAVEVMDDVAEQEIRGDAVVLCTGGSSYPNGGTTGDGWPWLRNLGLKVNRPNAALAPIYLEGEAFQPWSGISLRDVVLRARQGKEIARWRGDLLFTHQGISGPAALGISRVVAERFDLGKIELLVDLFPDRSFEEVGADLLAFATEHPSRRLASYVAETVPDRLVEAILVSAGVDSETVGARFDRKSRNRLAEELKAWNIGTVRHVPLEKGEVVAGGVDLSEVDSKTMAARTVPGLYLCGEILDVAGPVGGYNLQAAFATGYVAGEHAALG